MPRIDVPIHNQVDNEIKNDCGVVCDQMLIHGYVYQVVTVESYYTELGITPGGLQSLTNLTKFLNNHGVQSNVVSGMSLSRLKNCIDNGIPFIALISLKKLADSGVACYNADVNHFVVVVGYDDTSVIINDPLCPGLTGKDRVIPTQVFLDAWRYLDTQFTAIIPTYKMGSSPSGTHIVVVSSALNVRYGPGTNYAIVGTLYNGQYVTVTRIEGYWAEIGVNRWVCTDYLQEITNPTPSQSPSESPSPEEQIVIEVIVPKGVIVMITEKET